MSTISTAKTWSVFHEDNEAQAQLLAWLPNYMSKARWFGGKALQIESLQCNHCLPMDSDGHRFYFFIIEVNYTDHSPEYYLLPLAFRDEPSSTEMIAYESATEKGFLYDACHEHAFQKAMFEQLMANKNVPTTNGVFAFERGTALPESVQYSSSRNPGVDQSNSSIVFNEQYFMKIYRKLFLESNPEVEMLKFLTETGGYTQVPAYMGRLAWERKKTPPVTLALMMNKVEAQRDNWSTTGDELNDFLDAFLKERFSIHEFVFEQVELLAKRTAEMHAALAKPTKDKAFKAEKFTPEYREWYFTHLKELLEGRLALLRKNKSKLDAEAMAMAQVLFDKQKLVMSFFEQIKTKSLRSIRTRIHGDYHLGQVLYHNHDFIIIDFEGEPESSITDRKVKHSPLKDVAGMIRSYHYAVCAKLYYSKETAASDNMRISRAADRWFFLIRETFTETYLEHLGKDQKLYYNKAEINFLFLLHLLEKAIYEVGYELNGRPDWLKIPLRGIVQVINELEKFEG